ncbi:hypothetical protein [Desemzia sp. FAM 23989]|uniref:hypothetical protein n=1 Tax=Desemzia sp. FAM 23989 TaxID=3259523 RepID=UPI0038848379
MSVEFWLAAETFYNTTMVAVAVVILVLLMLTGMILGYSKSRHKKKIAAGGGVLILGLSIWLVAGHLRYNEFLEVNDHVTPLVRDRQKTFGDYIYRSEDEMQYFGELHDPESVRALEMYEEETVTEPIIYVGKDANFYYFEQDDELFKQRANVIFDTSAEETVMIGTTFHLMNESFFEIGFRNPPYIMYDRIVVNQEDTDELIDVENDDFVDTAEEHFSKTWSF